MDRRRVIIMGAAGRDFHNFNTVFRDSELYEVVAFTATQIPDIAGRKYPAELAGKLYPKGIPIYPEEELEVLIAKYKAQLVIFAYSDVPHEYVMHQGARVNVAGCDFAMLGPSKTMIKSKKPVVAVCAVRTGSGKSQTTRKVCGVLKDAGLKVAAIRHPMPYGDLTKQICQRFAKLSDLDTHKCTIEEREEYEPHIVSGTIIYAGVDYGVILAEAEKEADVIVWDGGNNDTAFYKPDLYITVADPHRAGHERSYYPGETNILHSDVVVINKIDSADPQGIEAVRTSIVALNPTATIIDAASPLTVEGGEKIRGKRVLVVEDGPTLTHGEMQYGAGIVAARKYGAIDAIDPRPFVQGSIADTFQKYPNIGPLLPAMGYGAEQIKDLEATIAAAPVDCVVIATPIDLRRLITIKQPTVRVGYDLQEIGRPDLAEVLQPIVEKAKRKR